MRHFLGRLAGLGERKASRTQGPRASAAAFYYAADRPVWTPRDYAALAREGFQRNAVVHRAVRLVAEAAASVPLGLVAGGADDSLHPLSALLARPNPREGGLKLLESLYGHLMVSGNAALWSKCTKAYEPLGSIFAAVRSPCYQSR